jgi:hypothetical protein
MEMSEDEARRANEEAADEVEAHARRTAATDEPAEEAEGDDDVEAHGRRVV